jgi:hypothetical protein
MRIVGVDLSLTATGIACECGTSVVKPARRGMERLADIRASVLAHARGFCVDPEDFHPVLPVLVVLEGYGFHSMKGVVLGELGGVVRLALWENGFPFVDVPPAVLKKFATGKGNVGKDAMLAAAIRRFGFDGSDNNEVDAHLLRCMGIAHYGLFPVPWAASDTHDGVTAYMREAVGKVSWPEIREEARA